MLLSICYWSPSTQPCKLTVILQFLPVQLGASLAVDRAFLLLCTAFFLSHVTAPIRIVMRVIGMIRMSPGSGRTGEKIVGGHYEEGENECRRKDAGREERFWMHHCWHF